MKHLLITLKNRLSVLQWIQAAAAKFFAFVRCKALVLKEHLSPLLALFARFKKQTSQTARRLIAAFALFLLCLPFCLKDVAVAQAIYLVGDSSDVIVVDDSQPDVTYTSQLLQINNSQGSQDAQIVLSDKTPVTILHGEDTRSAQSRNETVANLLRRLNIDVAENEMVAVDISDSEVRIRIGSSLSFVRNEDVETPFNTEYVANPDADKGTDTVLQEGVNGVVTQTYQDTYENGQVVSSELIGETADNSTTQIISQGTRVSSVDRSSRIVDVTYREDGSGYLTFTTGETIDFSNIMTCSATAYSGGSRTASGRPTGVGNIAVDPTVIPYGTQMFIQTTSGSIVYGMATAADCGSGIKGNELDLWFETYDESCQWGRRNCTVYILK